MSNIFTDKNTGRFSAISFILILTLAIHALVILMPQIGMYIFGYGGLRPAAVIHGEVWRLLTYAFLHSTHGFFHIAFNMLGLWMFGKEIEYMWGSRRFFEFYFFTAIFAGLFSLSTLFFAPTNMNIIGASGAIMALLVVYAYYFPNRQLLFFFVFPMKVKTAVIIYAIVSVLGTANNNVGGVAHITHLGGLIAGFIWIQIGDRFDLVVRNIGAFFQNASTKRSQDVEYTFGSDEPSQRMNFGRAETVDKILDKINRHGIHSLSPSERKILQEASADYRNNR